MASLDGRRSRVWGTEYGVQRHVSGSYPRQDDAEVRFHKRGTLHIMTNTYLNPQSCRELSKSTCIVYEFASYHQRGWIVNLC